MLVKIVTHNSQNYAGILGAGLPHLYKFSGNLNFTDFRDLVRLAKFNPRKFIHKHMTGFTCIPSSYKLELSSHDSIYRIMQIVRGRKLSCLHALLVIRGKTFTIVLPVQFAEKSGTT